MLWCCRLVSVPELLRGIVYFTGVVWRGPQVEDDCTSAPHAFGPVVDFPCALSNWHLCAAWLPSNWNKLKAWQATCVLVGMAGSADCAGILSRIARGMHCLVGKRVVWGACLGCIWVVLKGHASTSIYNFD